MRNDPEPLGKISQSKICRVCRLQKAVCKYFKYALLIPPLVEVQGLTYSCSSQITQSLTMLKNVSGFKKNL